MSEHAHSEGKAKTPQSWQRRLWKYVVIAALSMIAIGKLWTHSALFPVTFHSWADRKDDVRTGNNAVDEAVGRAHLRGIKNIAQKIDSGEINNSQELKQLLDPLRENTREMQAVAKGQSPFEPKSGVSQTSRTQAWEWRPPLNASTQDLGNGTYQVTIDPRREWQDGHVPISGNHTITITTATDDKMCSPPEPCVGPQGLTNLGFARFETIRRNEYADSNAIYHELIGRFDNNQSFRIGATNTIQIPEGANSVHFMANIRTPYLNEAGGGWVMRVTIQ